MSQLPQLRAELVTAAERQAEPAASRHRAGLGRSLALPALFLALAGGMLSVSGALPGSSSRLPRAQGDGVSAAPVTDHARPSTAGSAQAPVEASLMMRRPSNPLSGHRGSAPSHGPDLCMAVSGLCSEQSCTIPIRLGLSAPAAPAGHCDAEGSRPCTIYVGDSSFAALAGACEPLRELSPPLTFERLDRSRRRRP